MWNIAGRVRRILASCRAELGELDRAQPVSTVYSRCQGIPSWRHSPKRRYVLIRGSPAMGEAEPNTAGRMTGNLFSGCPSDTHRRHGRRGGPNGSGHHDRASQCRILCQIGMFAAQSANLRSWHQIPENVLSISLQWHAISAWSACRRSSDCRTCRPLESLARQARPLTTV